MLSRPSSAAVAAISRAAILASTETEDEAEVYELYLPNAGLKSMLGLSRCVKLRVLDLSFNSLCAIEGLDACSTLRVLMLGKNLLRGMANLHCLTRLDVLDLHSNNIQKVEALDGLGELRVLNLAGNGVCVLEKLGCVPSLTELNLRRNNIERVDAGDAPTCLQRLFLSNNRIKTLAQVPQSAASVIVATEPLWASAFGLLLLGEGLDPQCVVGGALVVAACVVSGLEPAAVRAALPFLPGGVRSR